MSAGATISSVFKGLAKATGNLALMIEQKRIPRQGLADTLAALREAEAELAPLVEQSSQSSS